MTTAVDQLLRSQHELHHTWFEGSTLNQRALLYALAKGAEIFSQGAIMKYDLGAVSTVQAALLALVKKGLANKEGSKYALADPFFTLWLMRR